MEDKWINVKERLPKPYERVLVYVGGPTITIGHLITEQEIRHLSGITHWQPLPAPPNIEVKP